MIQCFSHNWLSDICLNNSHSQMVASSFRSKDNETREWSGLGNHCHVAGCVRHCKSIRSSASWQTRKGEEKLRRLFFLLWVFCLFSFCFLCLFVWKVIEGRTASGCSGWGFWKVKKELCVCVCIVYMWVMGCHITIIIDIPFPITSPGKNVQGDRTSHV